MELERNQKNCVKILNPESLSQKTIDTILFRFRHLGYDLDAASLRSYLDRKVFLQPDQSKIIHLLQCGQESEEKYDVKQIRDDTKRAIKKFGYTYNFDKAGYLLLSGDMLDFSHGQYRRVHGYDHRAIGEVLTIADELKGATESMLQFMEYGHIRITSCGFDMMKRPTKQQYAIIKQSLLYFTKEDDELYVEINNELGYTVKSLVYKKPFLYEKIRSDVESYFNSLMKG